MRPAAARTISLLSFALTYSGLAAAQTPAPPAAAPPAPPAPAEAAPPPPLAPPAVVTPPAVVAPGPVLVTPLPPPPPAAPSSAVVSSKWSTTFYGFAEFDAIHDSTQSFGDLAGNGAIAKPGTYAGEHDRLQFGIRNSRLGFKVNAPTIGEVKTSGVAEMDFIGQGGNIPSGTSEGSFFTSPLFRVRHFYFKIETPYVDILAGQYWELFGWQPFFTPNTVQIQGVANEIYSRAPQFRLSHTFKTDPLNVELAVAAVRPPQRDSGTPDGQGGIKFTVNDWKGLHTGAGGGSAAVDGLSIGASGLVRHFEVTDVSSPPTRSIRKNSWAFAADLLLPVIPATMDDRGNAFTITGEFSVGTGYPDVFTGLNYGASFPKLPNGNAFSANIDPGIMVYSPDGTVHPVNWRTFIVGFQYYLPPGNIWVAGNYSQGDSTNLVDLVGTSGAAGVFKKLQWIDGNIFWDVTNAVRFGVEYSYYKETYGDGTEAKNTRVQGSGFFIF